MLIPLLIVTIFYLVIAVAVAADLASQGKGRVDSFAWAMAWPLYFVLEFLLK